jgi:hypothetical protein
MQALITALAFTTTIQGGTIDYGGQTMNPSEVGELNTIGWSNDENYWAWDTELNGGGAMATAERTTAWTRPVGVKAYWRWEEGNGGSQQTWLDDVSADTLAAVGFSSPTTGHLIYQFQPSFYQSNHKLKPFSQLKTQYSFTLQGVSHTVKLQQQWEPNWTPASPGPGAARYKRAKVIVRVNGLPIGRTEYSDVLGYSINRIYLSPSRDCIAVSLARHTMVWFEGLNLLAEHKAFAGRYR